ncbi:MAG: family 16 glycosylhydrolase [Albidovulum sp.]|uniref:endo-1,3-1,4-beta-glycanase ExoK n=1 Tax=Albidovulum sp. TaxID=1872424 RepID=UPI003CAE7830
MKEYGIIPALAILLTAASAQAGESFHDDFDRFDRSRWYVSDGWANGDWQNCQWSERAVRQKDSMLTLSFTPGKSATHDYLCGEVQTRESYGYGTYEARLKTGKGSGLNAAFFSYIGPQQQQPHDEIDVEILLKDTSQVSLNTYVAGKPFNGGTAAIPPADQGFNTYAFIWEPDRLRWFVNGKLVHEAADADQLPITPQRIFFSLWGSDTLTDWMGPFTPPTEPVTMEVDWIAYTKASEPCRFPQSVLCGEL